MKRNPPRDQGESQASEAGGFPGVVLSGRKLWFFRLVAVIGIPALFFSLVESGLRISGYGWPTSFFVDSEFEGQPVRIDNPRFSWQFFPRNIARTADPLIVPGEKPLHTYRIFVLGASAAQGDPDSSFSFSRILEVMLRDRYPGVHFEIYNTAMTAINSHVVRAIARDCVRQDPDLFLVYLGNNEVVGPFGAGTVLTPVTSSLTAIRATLWLGRLRIGQLLNNLLQSLGWRSESPKTWEGMQMFLERQVRYDDPGMERVYDNFRTNLSDICQIARSSQVPVILSSVAVNLRNCAPLASLHRTGLDDEQQARWQSLFESVTESGKPEDTISHFLKAEEIDGEYADLHYRLGKVYRVTGDLERARGRFARALQLDTLRFRADSRINGIIRQTAQILGPSRGVYFVDAASRFADQSQDGIPGRDLFLEHVHMNFSGNYLLARLFFEQVVDLLPGWIREQEQVERQVLSESHCRERLVYTAYDRQLSEQDILNRIQQPPFTNRSDNEEERQYLLNQLEHLPHLDLPANRELMIEEYHRSIETNPGDWRLHYNFARLLDGLDLQEERLAQLTFVLNIVPHYALAWTQRGDALSEMGKYQEAVQSYEKALGIEPEKTGVLADIGIAYEKLGDADTARHYFNLSVQRSPGDVQLLLKLAQHKSSLGKHQEALDYYLLAGSGAGEARGEVIDGTAFAYLKLGNLEKAGEYYRKAVQLTPREAGAHNNLGNVLLLSGQSESALEHFQRAVQLSPQNVLFRLNLARAHTQLGQVEAARQEYEAVLRFQTANREARLGLSEMLMETSSFKEAIPHLEVILENDPRDPEANGLLGLALARTRRFSEAIPHFLKTLEEEPQNVSARLNLGNSFLGISQIEKAINAYESVLRLDADNLQANHNLAYCYLETREWQKAIHYFELYLQMNPGDARAREQLSIAQAKAGRK